MERRLPAGQYERCSLRRAEEGRRPKSGVRWRNDFARLRAMPHRAVSNAAGQAGAEAVGVIEVAPDSTGNFPRDFRHSKQILKPTDEADS